MNVDALIEPAIERAIERAASRDAPPKLVSAINHAVFPGGARVRPQLCLAVADACRGEGDAIDLAVDAAAAIELLHCASLVHDDLPCFDAAEVRRGKPAVHIAFGEALAVLAGDALIIAAFQIAMQNASRNVAAAIRIHNILAQSVGASTGLVAGQAWESEDAIDLSAYHRAKTGALFVAAAAAGAACAEADEAPWRRMGARLGEAYQIADDLRDHTMTAAALGKPAQQDAANNRPNAVNALGVEGAVEQLEALVNDAVDSVPDCAGADRLRTLILAQSKRLTPSGLLRAGA